MIRLRHAGIALALAVAPLTLSTGLAHAATTPLVVTQGSDYAVYDYDTKTLSVCDMESDGHWVYALYEKTSDSKALKLVDDNGSDAGCASVSGSVYRFRVCEDDMFGDSCSEWART
ncbi:hypothetical protein [Streptomyces sp. SID8352]|uniref:hypothetical protein n=1 Tax=Streptomyces sp. SID8352 TaxID=2690338 RepID=UPI00136C572E|nr:hypothetical protein [Streptomyces sp. SID8352]MYU21267.1 hypothetical protein [Streptomyces sp. SID8352]